LLLAERALDMYLVSCSSVKADAAWMKQRRRMVRISLQLPARSPMQTYRPFDRFVGKLTALVRDEAVESTL